MPHNSKTMIFSAVRARQCEGRDVLCFAASAKDVQRIARIERAGRTSEGALFGFQRPQIASHIREIRDYLARPDALLPNPVVVAFTDDVAVRDLPSGLVELEINLAKGPPGLVVDGQQRLTALAGLPDKQMEIFVSALICRDEDELRQQFVLINSTRPLPKSLIYELLPEVRGLPPRLQGRALAARMTEWLNYHPDSFLRGQIYQHTNPGGRIRDTSIQRVILNSLTHGALRELRRSPEGEVACLKLVSEFYAAVAQVFPDAWHGTSPKTSRLVHGAGIAAMGFVMELLFAAKNAHDRYAFAEGLRPLVGRCAWTEGVWEFGPEDRRPWSSIQNVTREIELMADYLLKVVRSELRSNVPSEKPATQAMLL